VLHDGMPLDPIQDEGHGGLKVDGMKKGADSRTKGGW